MTVRFAPEAAKREMTPVDNLFFSVYMPEADGMFVKVYLYGLMQCYHASMKEDSIAEALGVSESDVRCAFVYWQAKGLVRIDSEEPFVVEYLLSDRPSLTTATDLKYRPFVRAVNDLLAPRQLELRELRALYDCMEVYELEEAAVLELIAYCIDLRGTKVPANYIRATAKAWSEQGVLTADQAHDYVESYRAKRHGASEILLRWNKKRLPTRDEMDLYEKWTTEWGFDEEAILAICPQLVDVSQPTFAILNDRIEAMRDKNASTAQSVRDEAARMLDDRAFAKFVFERLGKIGVPKPVETSQLAMFRREKEISEEAILLAADSCKAAERPFGILKKILLDWAASGVHTAEEAQKALEARQTAYRPAKKKNRAVSGYDQRPISDRDIEHMIVDLSEDI